MNLRLDPPQVPPLSTAERTRLRNRVMDQARPSEHRPRRQWIAPLVGVGAVAAVVAGTLVVTHKSPTDVRTAGTPAPVATRLQGTPEAKVGVDRGPVPQAELATIVADCSFPDETGPAQLVWSRHVRGITKDSTALVALARDTSRPTAQSTVARGRKPGPGGAPDFAKLGYRFCMSRVPPSAKLGAIGSVGRVADKTWRAEPTTERGLVTLSTQDGDFTADLTTLQAWRLYRAHPDVAKVEARYVLNGKPGPWTSGVVDGGFAYTEVQARGKFTVGQRLTTEVRAFDAQGKQLPVS
ncbi:hypothetical protein [Kribbella sp.]|uniref:hypothetical protein n=1 Tax=Kribbella sp. TaxID=1871183 RepID=UPI002D743B05|nr:hypothetical protein [Kribbella sp.]HZX04604.1 hypothetical protein [Kribbella sp.]